MSRKIGKKFHPPEKNLGSQGVAKGNPKGPGTTTIGVNMPTEKAEKLRKLASKSDLSLSKYCTRILGQAADQNIVFNTSQTTTETVLDPKKDSAPAGERFTVSTAKRT